MIYNGASMVVHLLLHAKANILRMANWNFLKVFYEDIYGSLLKAKVDYIQQSCLG